MPGFLGSIFSKTAFFTALLAFLSRAALAAEAGILLNVTPGAFINRGGAEKQAAAKDSVQEDDVLRTDGSGRMRVLLGDDSSLDFGPDTLFNMEEYAFGGPERPAFGGRLAQGFMRVITGKVVEQNPNGFKISTPEGGVGIRGTIFSLRSGNGTTTLFVENTRKHGVYLQDTVVLNGYKAVIHSDGRVIVSPMTEGDRNMLRNMFSAGRGKGPGVQPALANAGAGFNNNPAMGQGSDLVQTSASDLLNTAAFAPNSASYAGSFNLGGSGVSGGGNFGFDVNLTSGAASGAFMSGTHSGSPYGVMNINLTGGSGGVSGGSLNISDFSGGITSSNGNTFFNNGSSITSRSFAPGAASVPVDINVRGLDRGENVFDAKGSGTAVKK